MSFQGSPILLGSFRTNRWIAAFLGSEEALHFGYRQDPDDFRFVFIEKPTAEEREALSSRYEIAAIPGGIRAKERAIQEGTVATLKQRRDRLVIVHRMNVPGTRRIVTIIASEATAGIKQVVKALCNDDDTGGIVESFHCRMARFQRFSRLFFQ